MTILSHSSHRASQRFEESSAIWFYKTDDPATLDERMVAAAAEVKTDDTSVYIEPVEKGHYWRVGVTDQNGNTEYGAVYCVKQYVSIAFRVLIEHPTHGKALILWREVLERNGLKLVHNPHWSSSEPVRLILNSTPERFMEWVRKRIGVPNWRYGTSVIHFLSGWKRQKDRLAVVVHFGWFGEDGVLNVQLSDVPVIELDITDIGGGRIEVIAVCGEGLLDEWFDQIIELIAETYPECRANLPARYTKQTSLPATEGKAPARLPAGANRQAEYDDAYAFMKELIAKGVDPKRAWQQALFQYCKAADKDPGEKDVRDSFRAAMKLRQRKEEG